MATLIGDGANERRAKRDSTAYWFARNPGFSGLVVISGVEGAIRGAYRCRPWEREGVRLVGREEAEEEGIEPDGSVVLKELPDGDEQELLIANSGAYVCEYCYGSSIEIRSDADNTNPVTWCTDCNRPTRLILEPVHVINCPVCYQPKANCLCCPICHDHPCVCDFGPTYCLNCGGAHQTALCPMGSGGGSGGKDPKPDPDPDPDPKPDPPTPPADTSKAEFQRIAPNATRIFGLSNLTNEQWLQVEQMVLDILDDCLGGKMFNHLEQQLNGRYLTISYVEGKTNPGMSYGSRMVELGNLTHSTSLMHELFHHCQTYQESSSQDFTRASANLELEAQLAKMKFLERLSDPGEEWEINQMNGDEYIKLTKMVDRKGMVIGGRVQEFHSQFVHMAQDIQFTYTGYTYDAGRSLSTNLRNLLTLASDC